MEKKTKSIEILNRLIEINNDRIEGYKAASEEIGEKDLKTLFVRFAQTSQDFNQELSCEVYKLGGYPTDGTTISGKFFRSWMNIKSSIIGADRYVILDSCEYVEDHAVEIYENVLRNELQHLFLEQLSLIRTQYSLIKNDQFRLKSIRSTASKYNT
jgi:uncharacterized protein (TIGR02284 family)